MFRSFFLGGFECATGYNMHGEPLDQVAATQHDRFADADYALLAGAGILAAREAVRWPLVDRNGRHDFASLRPFVAAARRHRIEVVWDLFHYGYPDSVDLLSEEFPERFAAYCHAAARWIGRESDGPPWFTPINEPSYFAWAAGEAALFAPHLRGHGWPLKVQLARAALRGIEAIRAACPDARILNVDAICHVVAPADRPDLEADARHFNESIVFEGFDLLAGKRLPQLGGSREALGVVGLNYYWSNQWELGRTGVPLAADDPRRVPLRELVRRAWDRYGRDVVLSETAHIDDQRAPWILYVADECEALLDAGVPLRGVCLYPILGMPEWHTPATWARMGLWDLVPQSPELSRIPVRPALEALRIAQRLEGRQHRPHPIQPRSDT